MFLTALVLELCSLSRHSQFETQAKLCCPEGGTLGVLEMGIEEKLLSVETEGTAFSVSWSPACSFLPILLSAFLKEENLH